MSQSSVMSADFLVEIGTEELPPKALLSLSQSFTDEICAGFTGAKLGFGEVTAFAAPRRLAVLIKGLEAQAPDEHQINWGAPAKVAFDADGNPTRAAEAFAHKNGVAVEELKILVENDGQQDKLCVRKTLPGASAEAVIGDIINAALTALPIPKRMRWGARREEFVRPLHWAVVLYGNQVVPCQVLGIAAGNRSRGHRFHCNQEIVISAPGDYQQAMRNAHVIADFAERRELIRQGVVNAAAQAGGLAVIGDALLDEVTALNEWPVPLVGQFEKRFLEVPSEALISSMAEHQKYFHAVDSEGKLLPMFITVANIDSKDPAQVIDGNERVIRPRLSDAAFFYQTDLKTSLAERRERLRSIVFQQQLGTLFDKTKRVAALADYLSPVCGADPALARRAAELSKSDLVSEMVGEFDDLQGIMGRYYALHDGEADDVASAMFEQYLPRFAGDAVPSTSVGAALALADRLDTLVGIFGIGQPPSGSKDPFALRRASLGVLRVCIERGLELDLADAIAVAAGGHATENRSDETNMQALTYIIERLKSWYRDEGISAEVFASVAALSINNPVDFDRRVRAVQQFTQLAEAESLAAANKRVANILSKQAAEAGDLLFDESRLLDDAEKLLYTKISELESGVADAVAAQDFGAALLKLSGLRETVDNFFDQVMVMAEDQALRNNRLALLQRLRNLFLQIADISHLSPGK